MGTNDTKLPANIKKIMRRHRDGLFKIHKFLVSLGFESDYIYRNRGRLDRITAVEIKIRHDNDYIECGPLSDDPEGKLFSIFTLAPFEAKINIAKYAAAISHLEAFAFPEKELRSDPNMAVERPKGMDHILLKYFSWERKIKYCDSRPKTIIHQLDFRIYHTWK